MSLTLFSSYSFLYSEFKGPLGSFRHCSIFKILFRSPFRETAYLVYHFHSILSIKFFLIVFELFVNKLSEFLPFFLSLFRAFLSLSLGDLFILPHFFPLVNMFFYFRHFCDKIRLLRKVYVHFALSAKNKGAYRSLRIRRNSQNEPPCRHVSIKPALGRWATAQQFHAPCVRNPTHLKWREVCNPLSETESLFKRVGL